MLGRSPRPWGDYATRILCCVLLFASGFTLIGNSTFAWRLRDDISPTGVQGIAIGLSALLAFLPLAFGRRYLGALLVSGFLMSGMGAYWWTTIPWDELIKETDFTSTQPPGFLRYVHIASPAIVALLYVAASSASRMRADHVGRGVDEDEASHAAAASFLAGMGVIAVCMTLAMAMWSLLAAGTLQALGRAVPTGLPAILLAAGILAGSYLLASRPWRPSGGPRVKRPSRSGAGRGVLARIRARRSPS